jgi:GDPmannose 4,6-dehydratase
VFRTCSGMRATSTRESSTRESSTMAPKHIEDDARPSSCVGARVERGDEGAAATTTPKVALVLGVTGQTGSYLTDLLLSKGYIVHGLTHSTWQNYPERLRHVMCASSPFRSSFVLHQGDILEFEALVRLFEHVKPCEIYNLAAQSSVHLSFQQPLSTVKSVGLGVFNVIEAIRTVNQAIKLFQASSSEIFGKTKVFPQRETTPPCPCSPYANAKLMAHQAVIMHREAYGLYAVSGILYNHESSRRGANFVTQKIVTAAVRIKHGLQQQVELGNLNSRRDWGHAQDFVVCMWKMLQLDEPEDFIVATGKTHTVRQFVTFAFKAVGIDVEFQNSGTEEIGINKATGEVIVKVDPKYFRPDEPIQTVGDSTKAFELLQWQPEIDLAQLIEEMVTACEWRLIHGDKQTPTRIRGLAG